MSIRRRLVLLLCGILVVSLATVGNELLESFRRAYASVVEDMMYEFSTSLATQVEKSGGLRQGRENLRVLFEAYREKRGERDPERALNVYVTDENGNVVFSSANPSEEGKDYSQWNDVYLALQGKYGARSTRLDKGNPYSSVYFVASPILLNGKISGAVSVVKTEESVAPFLAKAFRRGAPYFALFAGAIALFTLLVMLWITHPIHRMRDYALRIAEGQPASPPKMQPRELADLLSAFESMRTKLEGRKTIETYVQGLIHELKSPLTAIRGAAELSLENVEQGQREKFLHNILSEGNRMQRVLDQLLGLAQLQSQPQLEKRDAISLNALAEEVARSLKIMADTKGISLAIKGDAKVSGDPLLLEQAVRNLVVNALQFSPSGALVRVESGERQGKAWLSVADQGPGVPAFAGEKIFEKFYSLPRPDGSGKSSGLGLNFVQEIMKMHGGEVKLASAAPGAIFILELPSA